MKISPKSCSCRHCKIGKHKPYGQFFLKADERANRHAVSSELAKLRGINYNLMVFDELEDLMVPTVPIGNYYD